MEASLGSCGMVNLSQTCQQECPARGTLEGALCTHVPELWSADTPPALLPPKHTAVTTTLLVIKNLSLSGSKTTPVKAALRGLLDALKLCMNPWFNDCRHQPFSRQFVAPTTSKILKEKL